MAKKHKPEWRLVANYIPRRQLDRLIRVARTIDFGSVENAEVEGEDILRVTFSDVEGCTVQIEVSASPIPF